MRNVLLLVLACVVVTVSKAADVEMILLEESIASADDILQYGSEKILELYVTNVLDKRGCSVETLCQTAAALKKTPLNISYLHRQLHAYVSYKGHMNCSVPTADEYLMKALLKDLKRCLKKCNLQNNHKKHH